MNRDDIIRMALEAGLEGFRGEHPIGWGEYAIDTEIIEKFAALIAAEIMPKEALAEMFEWGKDAGRREEREACAKVAEEESAAWHICSQSHDTANRIAAAIRARGKE